MLEVDWYKMMGITKIFLRNFIIASFILTITTIIILASLLRLSYEDRGKDRAEFTKTILDLKEQSQIISETKSKELIDMLKETIKIQKNTDLEISNIKKNYPKK